jgi:hypothetical protein
MGDLLPGYFVVPNNPITSAAGGPGATGIGRVAHVGELMPASFVVPENPLMNALVTVGRGPASQKSLSGLGGGCGCTGLGCGCGDRMSLSGLGEFNMDSVTQNLNPANWSATTMAMVGGGVLLLILMMRPGGSEYKAAVTRAKADYQSTIASIRKKYKRVGGRVASGTAAAARYLREKASD